MITFTLSAPGLSDLVLGEPPYAVAFWDLGYPLPREVVEDKPDTDGQIDTTALEGGRVITVRLNEHPWTWADIQAVKAYTRQSLRPIMLIAQDGAPVLRGVVRSTDFSDPVSLSLAVAQMRDITLQWSVPSGILESTELHTVVVTPGAGNTDGLEFGTTLEFGPTLEFPLVDPPGVSEVVNAGDRPAQPVLRAFGPFGDEGNAADETEIANLTTGESLIFAGTGIVAGDYLEIDVSARTILVNGKTAQSRYGRLKFPDSDWWALEPMTNEIAFRPDTFSGNAQMHVVWRDAHS